MLKKQNFAKKVELCDVWPSRTSIFSSHDSACVVSLPAASPPEHLGSVLVPGRSSLCSVARLKKKVGTAPRTSRKKKKFYKRLELEMVGGRSAWTWVFSASKHGGWEKNLKSLQQHLLERRKWAECSPCSCVIQRSALRNYLVINWSKGQIISTR